MKRNLLYIILLVLLVGCGGAEHRLDPLLRARVDGLNKESFVCRYKDPVKSLAKAEEALALIADSLPDYNDGRLRAWNNKAFGHYMLTQIDQADPCIDSVLMCATRSADLEMEQVIARLLRARVLQMACRIADSYQMLYDIDRSGALDRHTDNYLHDYAQTEFYITSLTLNYSYRKGMEASLVDQIAEIELQRDHLRCDFAQDLALNYALAYGYSRILVSAADQAHYLGRSLDCCLRSLRQMRVAEAYSLHELANIVQMMAFLVSSDAIADQSWQANADRWNEACRMLVEDYGVDLDGADDLALRLFEVSTRQFRSLDDPTQRMAASIATGLYCLERGDTLLAQQYYLEPLSDTILPAAFIPRFEAMLYNGLMLSGAGTAQQRQQWYMVEREINDIINQNQKADFLLQNELSRSKSTNRIVVLFLIVLGVLFVVLAVLAVLLDRKQHALKAETERLKAAKRQDVERIANVETCLSVLRHDITPFMSYLRNKNLPEELRHEVQDQMLRTFDNIKNWTNLSIPTGLQYRGSVFPLQEVWDSTWPQVSPYQSAALAIVFEPTQLSVNADKLLLEILLRNLVSNAVRYTSQGQVRVSAAAEGDFVHVAVADTGAGMDEEQLESLFRADKQPSAEGEHSGFGLILCRYIIKKHDDNSIRGCRIWAESTPGQGSTFHFLIAKS